MEKIKIDVKIPENKKLEYHGKEILVIPYVDVENTAWICHAYISNLLNDWDFIYADFVMKMELYNRMTNIEIEGMENDKLSVLFSETYSSVTELISNYDDIQSILGAMLKFEIEKLKIEKSSGTVLQGLFDMLKIFIDDMKNLSPDKLKEFKEESERLLSTIENPVAQKSTKKRHKKVTDYVE